jgi:hypothetical protein
VRQRLFVLGGTDSGGILHFMAQTMARSRVPRIIWMAYAGGAAAVLVNSAIVDNLLWGRHGSLQRALAFLVRFWELACSAVLIAGVRHVLRLPSDLHANWIFACTKARAARNGCGP